MAEYIDGGREKADRLAEMQKANGRAENSPEWLVNIASISCRMNNRALVSGHLESGQLIAIIGPSGAGKTTLMAAVSQRFRGKMSGGLSLNGRPIGRREMTRISCFVPQIDITIDTLTPYEHLQFMAELKVGDNWNDSEKRRRITMLLWRMGLERVAGNPISTLSGGERKKLNLAADVSGNELSFTSILRLLLYFSC